VKKFFPWKFNLEYGGIFTKLFMHNNGSHDMKQTDSSIIIVRNVCVLTSASMIVYLFFTRSWSAIIGPKLFFTRSWLAIIEPKLLRGTFTKLFMHSMFQVEICSQQLEICKSMCMFIVLRHCCGDWLTFFQWLPIMTSWRKDKQSWMLR
jgi:hypothetical protein